MQKLNETYNKHFYYSGTGCLFNTNSENCIAFFDEKDSSKKVQFFESGALITRKTSNNIDITFIKNNNERLVNIHETDLVEMGNSIFDINATVYTTGVLIDIQNYKNENMYEYILYNGASFKDTNFDRLKTSIENYEKNIGCYFNREEREL